MKSRNDPMRLVELMNLAARCGASTRTGAPCRQPAVRGKRRCRMHGGAAGSGGQIGNRNAFKHGHWSAEETAFRKVVSEMIKKGRELAGPN